MPRVAALLATLLTAAAAWAAAGDITSATVLATGWEAEIVIEGRTPPVTAYAGYGDPNQLTPPTAVRFDVTSPGYTTAGAATTVTRTVYATRTQRQLDPNEANAWEFVDGGTNLLIRVALSDYIYSGDTATVTVAASWATTAGGASNAKTAGAVTNNSTLGYPAVHAQWAWPDLQLWDAATLAAGYTLEAVAVDHWATNGKLAQAVKFTLTGVTSSATLSATVTAAALSPRTYPYAQTVPKATTFQYTVTAAALAAAGFADNERVRVACSAYPRIGDSSAVTTTSAGDPNTTLFTEAYYIYDPDTDYGQAFARVDPTGNDATAAVATSAAGATNPYSSIRAAAAALKSYNNANYSRNEPGAATILLNAGSYTWTGDPNALTDLGAQDVWLTVRGDVTDPNDAKITGYTTSRYLEAQRLKLENLTLDPTTPGDICVWGKAGQWLWLDRCRIDQNGNGSPPAPYNYTAVFLTRSIWPNGAYAYYWSATNTGVRLTRNCYLDHGSASGSGGLMPYAALANTAVKCLLYPPADANASPHSDGGIVAWNALYKTQATLVSGGTIPTATRGYTKGITFLGNVIEKTTSTNPAIELAANLQTTACNNIRLIHNTFVGERENLAYSQGSASAARAGWTMLGNVFRDFCTKHDAFSNDPADIGGKAQEYGVAARFNRNIAATFPTVYAGQGAGDGTVVAAFTWDRAYPDPNGLGDYTPGPLSELIGAIPAGAAPMPFDLWGTAFPNDGTGAAGAVQRTTAPAYYVATDGVNTTAGGRGLSEGLPWATLSYAYTQAPGGTVYVAAGTYDTGAAGALVINGNKTLTFQGAGQAATLLAPSTYSGQTVYVANGTYSGTITLRDLGIIHPASATTAAAVGQTFGTTSQVSLALYNVALTLPASYAPTAGAALQLTNNTGAARALAWAGGTLTCGSATTCALVYAKANAVTLADLTLPASAASVKNLLTVAAYVPTISITGLTGKTGQLAVNPTAGAACDFAYCANNVIESGVWGSGTDPNQGGFFRWADAGIADAPRLAVFVDNTLTGRNDMIYVADPNAAGSGGGHAIAIGNTVRGTGDGTTAAHGIGPGTAMHSFYRYANAIYMTGANTYGAPAKSKNATLLNNVVEAFVPITLAGGYDKAGTTDPNNYQTGAVVANNTARVNSPNGLALQIEQFNGISGAPGVKSWPVEWRVYNNVFDAAGVAGAYAVKLTTVDAAPAGFYTGWIDGNTYRAGGTYLANIGGTLCTTLGDLQNAWATAGRDGNDDHSTLSTSALPFPSNTTGAALKNAGATTPTTTTRPPAPFNF